MRVRGIAVGTAVVLLTAWAAQPAAAVQAVSPPVTIPLGADDSAESIDHSLVVDAAGTAYTVFTVARTTGGNAVLLGSRPKGGSWSVTEVDTGNVSSPDIAVDGNGNRVIVWQKNVTGTQAHAEIWCKRTTADPSDFTLGVISLQTHDAHTPQVVIDEQQRGTVIWADDDPDPVDGHFDFLRALHVQTASVVKNPNDANDDVCKPGGAELARESSTSGIKQFTQPMLAVDGMGNVSAAWTELDPSGVNDVSSVVAARQVAGTGVWGKTPLVQNVVQPETLAVLDVTAADAGASTPGDVSVGLLHATTTAQTATVATRLGTGPDAGTWSSASLNPTGFADEITLASTPSGGTAAGVTLRDSTGTTVRRLDFFERGVGATLWSSAAHLSDLAVNARYPDLAVDTLGAATIVWHTGAGSDELASRHRPPGTTTWDAIVPVPDGGSSYVVQLGTDPQGVGTLVWANYGSTGTMHSATLTAAAAPPPAPPKASMTQPTLALQKAKAFTAAWTSTGGTGPVTYDVRYRLAPYNGTFGTYRTWRFETTATSGVLSASPGTTCLSVRGKASGAVGAWSAERCTAVPVDDRSLTASSGWTNGTSTGFYSNTFRRATALNASLSLKVRGRSFALLVARGPGQGKIKVYLGSTYLGTWNLAASTVQRQVIIPVKTLSTVGTGTIKVVVATSGLKVLIDGVYARQ